MSDVCAIIVAAGEGQRFGSPKLLAPLKGKRVLDYSLEAFDEHPSILEMVLVLRDVTEASVLMKKYNKLKAVTPGGDRRQDSVHLGFQCLKPRGTDIVLIHDAARPLVSAALMDRVIERARLTGAAVPGLRVSDTIKRIDGRNNVIRTLDRSGLIRIQTPQGFSGGVLQKAYGFSVKESWDFTDEAALVERMGHLVSAVPGDPRNIKITVPEDMKLAEALLDV